MEKLEKVDFLRGIAILGVFCYHASFSVFGYYEVSNYNGFFLDTSKFSMKYMLHNFMPYAFGGGGVSLFLVISGFLIHSGYFYKSRFEPTRFFNKRFWRIYPPYLLALIIFAVTINDGWNWKSFVSHFTLTNNFLEDKQFFTINPSFWSLALEVQLYLLYPLFLLLHKAVGMKSYWIIAAISTLYLTAGKVLDISAHAFQKSVLAYWMVWIAGAYLAECYHTGKGFFKVKAYHLFFLCFSIVLLKVTVIGYYLGFHLFILLCLLFMMWFLSTEFKETKLWKTIFLFISTLGIYSYSFYLFHQPFLDKLIIFFSRNHRALLFDAFSVVVVFLLFYLLSYISYKLVEVPSIKWGGKFYEYFLKREVVLEAAEIPSKP